MKPIVFVMGLSGVGKTYTAKAISREFSLQHIDIDRTGGGFAKAGFPREWDGDVARVDFTVLGVGVRSHLGDQDQGAVLSFPTTYRFTSEQLGVALTHGVGVILLWGALECCWDVRRKRQEKNKGTTPSRKRYDRKNEPTFEMYRRVEYDKFRVDALLADGSRPSAEELLALVLERLAKQGIQLPATHVSGGRRRCDSNHNA